MFWGYGMLAGACDKPAYGERPWSQQRWSPVRGEYVREDGRYNGYVPGLACPAHGGPKAPDRCPDGCQGIDLGDSSYSGCECKGATCDCPNHQSCAGGLATW